MYNTLAEMKRRACHLKKLGCITTLLIGMDAAEIVGFDSARIDQYAVGSSTLDV